MFIRPDHVSAVIPSRGKESEIHLQGGSRITVTGSTNHVLGRLGIEVLQPGHEHLMREPRPPSSFQGKVGSRGSEFGSSTSDLTRRLSS